MQQFRKFVQLKDVILY